MLNGNTSHGFTLVFVKIFPKVRQNLQKKRENSCTQVDDVTLMRPTISISWGRLQIEAKISKCAYSSLFISALLAPFIYICKCMCVFLTVDWPPRADCPSQWSLRAPAGGHRAAEGHSASPCCLWWWPHPGGEKLAWGTESLQNQNRNILCK